MTSDYWRKMESQPSFKEWLEFYEGCLHCACDHGCNQWIAEQAKKTMLIMRVMSNPKATTSLDKLAKMSADRADKLWLRFALRYRLNPRLWQTLKKRKKNEQND